MFKPKRSKSVLSYCEQPSETAPTEKKVEEEDEKQEKEDPLDKSVLDEFTQGMLTGMLRPF